MQASTRNRRKQSLTGAAKTDNAQIANDIEIGPIKVEQDTSTDYESNDESETPAKKPRTEQQEPKMHRKRYERRIRLKFQKDETIALIKAIEKRPVIWDMNHKKHYEGTSVRSAWRGVTDEINKETNDCRSGWASLRASFKYYTKCGADWEFGEYMAFLPKFTKHRGIIGDSSLESGNTSPTSTQEDSSSTFKSNAVLLSKNSLGKRRKSKGSRPSGSAHCKENSYSKRKSLPEKMDRPKHPKDPHMIEESPRRHDQLQLETCSPATSGQPTLKNLPALQYWDSLLGRLSSTGARNAEMAVTELLLERIKTEQKKN